MMKLFKNRIFVGALIFWVIDFIQGFAVLSPLLVFLRTKFEKTASVFDLWPLPSLDVLADLIINSREIIGFYFITAIIIMIIFQLLKSLMIAGVYNLIINRDNEKAEKIGSFNDFIKIAARNWTGFVKADIFAIPVFILALFLSYVIGNFVGNLGQLLKYMVWMLFLVSASTYLQIIRIQIIEQGSNSIREAIKSTRPTIAVSLVRIIVGNISVMLISFLGVYLFWVILKFVKGADWSITIAVLTILIQQLIVLIVCFAQALRINYNYSLIRKGE